MVEEGVCGLKTVSAEFGGQGVSGEEEGSAESGVIDQVWTVYGPAEMCGWR